MKLFNQKRARFPLLRLSRFLGARFLGTLLLGTLFLAACDGEGIDRLQNDAANGTSAPSRLPGNTTTGPSRFVQLEKINFEATLPSVISVMFQATDQYNRAIAGLQTSDFILLEDNEPVSAAETSLAIVPHEQLPFSLRTVIMIDVSSSISPADLDKIKAAVRGMITNAEGQSTLLPQQEVALYSFNDTVSLLRDFSSNTDSLVDTLDSIQPAIAITPTDFYGAVIAGTSRVEDTFDLEQISKGNVIIITDGTDTAARNSYRNALISVAGKSVYTLGIGDEISETVMQQIGTSGTYALRNFEQLNSVLTSINQQVVDSANSFYYLHYASPKRGAEGAQSSIHNIMLSVANNANRGATSVIVDRFDATDFSNVTAEVVVSGPKQLEVQQAGIYRASTRWGPQPISNFVWSLPPDNVSCQIDQLSSTSIRVTGIATGNCTLTAEDQSAGGAQGWYSIEVVAD